MPARPFLQHSNSHKSHSDHAAISLRRVWLASFILPAFLFCTPAHAEACYDLSKGQPESLTGKLDYVIFAGPPGFEDVQKGDTPEPSFVLRLHHQICITGDDFADPSTRFDSVQLVETKEMSGKLKGFLNKDVTLTLMDRLAAETGHHHEPLVAWVKTIAAASKPMDFTDEYGTAATVIRGFYAALHDGQGGVASQFIVPEKRHSVTFSADALTAFYGSLTKPIELLDIAQAQDNIFTAHYRYTSAKRVCDGKATITTVQRDGNNFIQAINALNGC